MRQKIPPKLRFEILKRSNFKCDYCGRGKADGVELQIDHVIAVAMGGLNDPTNLVTACAPCNLGKGARLLSDPKLIGADFKSQKAVMRRALKGLEHYREYLKEKEKFEFELCSELIKPLESSVCDQIMVWDINDGTYFWSFVYGWEPTPGHIPEAIRDCFPDIIQFFDDAQKRVRLAVMRFFKELGADAVRDSAVAAQYRVDCNRLDSENAFVYFCGICQTRIKERGGDRHDRQHS